MYYVKLNSSGEIEKYPYNLSELQVDFPNTSFAIPIEETSLNNQNIFRVAPGTIPQADHTKEIVEQSPVLQNGTWTQVFNVVPATQEQLQTKFDAGAYGVRKRRNELLANSDWTQVEDAPVNKQAWAAYRQALRNITLQEGFPWTVTWPSTPSS